jgi:hypothetical protein
MRVQKVQKTKNVKIGFPACFRFAFLVLVSSPQMTETGSDVKKEEWVEIPKQGNSDCQQCGGKAELMAILSFASTPASASNAQN